MGNKNSNAEIQCQIDEIEKTKHNIKKRRKLTKIETQKKKKKKIIQH